MGILRLLTGLLLLFSLPGCALILDGTNQDIKIHCYPDNDVTVVVNGKQTPLVDGKIVLNKKEDLRIITVQKEGYHSSTVALNREVNPFWPFADLIWVYGIPVAWIVDWHTGAWYKIEPDLFHVTLRKKES